LLLRQALTLLKRDAICNRRVTLIQLNNAQVEELLFFILYKQSCHKNKTVPRLYDFVRKICEKCWKKILFKKTWNVESWCALFFVFRTGM